MRDLGQSRSTRKSLQRESVRIATPIVKPHGVVANSTPVSFGRPVNRQFADHERKQQFTLPQLREGCALVEAGSLCNSFERRRSLQSGSGSRNLLSSQSVISNGSSASLGAPRPIEIERSRRTRQMRSRRLSTVRKSELPSLIEKANFEDELVGKSCSKSCFDDDTMGGTHTK